MPLPDDLWRVIATFSEDELQGILRLRLVNKQFAKFMKHPSVVWRLHLNFSYHRGSISVMVSDGCYRSMAHDGLGPLTAGVRNATIHK